MDNYEIIYSYVDGNGDLQTNNRIELYANNLNDAFITGAAKLYALYANTTYSIKSLTVFLIND